MTFRNSRAVPEHAARLNFSNLHASKRIQASRGAETRHCWSPAIAVQRSGSTGLFCCLRRVFLLQFKRGEAKQHNSCDRNIDYPANLTSPIAHSFRVNQWRSRASTRYATQMSRERRCSCSKILFSRSAANAVNWCDSNFFSLLRTFQKIPISKKTIRL